MKKSEKKQSFPYESRGCVEAQWNFKERSVKTLPQETRVVSKRRIGHH
jgi:hypothetical protein